MGGGLQWVGAEMRVDAAAELKRWLGHSFPKARWETPGDHLGVLIHRVRFPGRGFCLPKDHLFLDLETLGFVGRPIFLIGLFQATGTNEGQLVQLLARDYAEEEETLRHFDETYGSVPSWVTFNGKSFDLPTLRLRCAYHRLKAPKPEEHIDLLHVARRHFRGVFPDCRLTTLERRVCGRHRTDDLAGALVPNAYHRFIRETDPTLLDPILRHNRDDLVTLVELFIALADREES